MFKRFFYKWNTIVKGKNSNVDIYKLNTQTNAIVYKSKYSTDIVRKLYMYMYKQQLMRTNSLSLLFL